MIHKVGHLIKTSKALLLQASVLVILVSLSYEAGARHIIGGDLTYRCIDDRGREVAYEVTLIMYRDDSDANAADFDPTINLGIYEFVNGQWIYRVDVSTVLRSDDRILPVSPSPCLSVPTFNIFRGEYRFNITLPKTSNDYMFAYQRCCRNNTISNIIDPGEKGAAFTAILTPEGQQTCNSSAVFDDFPPIVICEGRQLTFDHGATDPEGDQLVYSFCAPLTAGGTAGTNPNDDRSRQFDCDGVTPDPTRCLPPYAEVEFRTPDYTETLPLAGNPVVAINPTTGVITGRPELIGQFVVGVCVQEFRNGQLIGEIRRDFQFNVAECPVNVQVDLDAELRAPKQYYIRSCGSETVSIDNLSQDIALISTYDWEFATIDGPLTSNERSPTITFPGVGNYPGFIILNRADSLCADTAAIVIDIFPEVVADFDFTYDTCIVGPVSFIDGSTTGAAMLTAREWDFGDGEGSDVQSPIHSYTEPASYTATLLVTDVNNCQDRVSREFVWAPLPPIVVVQPSVFVGCAPGEVRFDNLSEPVNELYDIEWDFGNGTTSSAVSPVAFYDEAGTYDVSVRITSPFGCSISEFYRDWITLRESPEARFVFDPSAPSIFNPDVQFIDQSIDAQRWTWRFGQEGFSSQQNPMYTFRDTGTYEVVLVVQHPSGCTDTMIQIIDIEPKATLFFPNAFTPNGDGSNETFVGVGFVEGISDYEMTIWNRWGEQIYQGDDPTTGWRGDVDGSTKLAQEGVYVYLVTYSGPRGEPVTERGSITLVR